MGIEISIKTTPPNGFVSLMNNTIWGTKERTRYKQTDVEHRIKYIQQPYYLSLTKSTKLLGVISLVLKNIVIAKSPIDIFYIRYFSFFHSYQTISLSTKPFRSKSQLRDQLNNKFSNGSLKESNLLFIYFHNFKLALKSPVIIIFSSP